MRRPSWTPSRSVVLALTGATVGLISIGAVVPLAPLLVWNASASAPIGLYLVQPQTLPNRDDMALIEPPVSAAKLAVERGYLPFGVPLVKRVAAVSGDTVCAIGSAISVNGKPVAERLAVDALGRPLPVWQGCRTLGHGEVFPLMASSSDSFDGRYFGPVTASQVLGRLVALWTE